MPNTYSYESFKNLSPAELLFFITIDETMQQ
jgi:hypothetical protein